MITRRKFTWKVALTDPSGETKSAELSNYWDPTKDFVTPETIALTAGAEATVASRGNPPYIGVLAELVE